MDLANPDCQHCDSKLKPLYTGFYCPNDLCYSNRGRPEFEAAHKKKRYEELYDEVRKVKIEIDDWICPACNRHFGGPGRCNICLNSKLVNTNSHIKNWRHHNYDMSLIVCLRCYNDNKRGSINCIGCSIPFN